MFHFLILNQDMFMEEITCTTEN